MKNPKEYLENCEYISQDGDTVYIDEEALEEFLDTQLSLYYRTFTLNL